MKLAIGLLSIATMISSGTAYHWYTVNEVNVAGYERILADREFEETMERQGLTVEQKSEMRIARNKAFAE